MEAAKVVVAGKEVESRGRRLPERGLYSSTDSSTVASDSEWASFYLFYSLYITTFKGTSHLVIIGRRSPLSHGESLHLPK